MGTKITASENMFRLRGCPEDDTILLTKVSCISSDVYVRTVSVFVRGGFIHENISKALLFVTIETLVE